jgi:hypothetical protein
MMTLRPRSGLATGGVPLPYLHLVWHELWPLLEPAVKRTPDYSQAKPGGRPDVLARLLARDAQLWAIYQDATPVAAIVTTIMLDRSAGDAKKCRLWLIGGARVSEWAGDFLPQVEDWARGLGCIALWASGREGWARLARNLGWENVGTVAGFPAWQRRL